MAHVSGNNVILYCTCTLGYLKGKYQFLLMESNNKQQCIIPHCQFAYLWSEHQFLPKEVTTSINGTWPQPNDRFTEKVKLHQHRKER